MPDCEYFSVGPDAIKVHDGKGNENAADAGKGVVEGEFEEVFLEDGDRGLFHEEFEASEGVVEVLDVGDEQVGELVSEDEVVSVWLLPGVLVGGEFF